MLATSAPPSRLLSVIVVVMALVAATVPPSAAAQTSPGTADDGPGGELVEVDEPTARAGVAVDEIDGRPDAATFTVDGLADLTPDEPTAVAVAVSTVRGRPLSDSARILATLTDRDGEPVTDATVALHDDEPLPIDDRGRFTLPPLDDRPLRPGDLRGDGSRFDLAMVVPEAGGHALELQLVHDPSRPPERRRWSGTPEGRAQLLDQLQGRTDRLQVAFEVVADEPDEPDDPQAPEITIGSPTTDEPATVRSGDQATVTFDTDLPGTATIALAPGLDDTDDGFDTVATDDVDAGEARISFEVPDGAAITSHDLRVQLTTDDDVTGEAIEVDAVEVVADDPDDPQAPDADVVVNSTADRAAADPGSATCDTGEVVDDQPECTLRAAVQASNATDDGLVVGLPAGTYELTLTGGGEGAAAGSLDVTSDLTLVGDDRDQVTIDAAGIDAAVFSPDDGADLTLVAVTVTGGSAPDRGGVVDMTDGGDLLVERSALTGNAAAVRGGAIWVGSGDVTIRHSELSGNTAGDNSGGALRVGGGGRVVIEDSQVTGNTAGSNGAVRAANSELIVRRSVVADNQAGNYGGGISATAGSNVEVIDSVIRGNDAPTYGGGIAVRGSTATVVDSVVEDNTAGSYGGGIAVRDSDLTMVDSTVEDNTAGSYGGGFAVRGDSDLTTNDSVIGNNTASSYGGGIGSNGGPSIELIGSRVVGNTADSDGGGIRTQNGGELTVRSSEVSGNRTALRGGGQRTSGAATVLIVDSTYADNHADESGGAIRGGGTTALTVRNSTLSGNRSDTRGGGIWGGSGDVTLVNVTLVDNQAGSSGNALHNLDSGSETIQGLLLSQHADIDGDLCSSAPTTSLGNNLATDDSCGLDADGDVSGVDDAGIGPLADNGGATPTHALDADSPAVDAGAPIGTEACGGTDQRGVQRPQGPGCDIGAFERERDEQVPVGSLQGTVTFGDDGAPLEDVTITVEASDDGGEPSADGRFERVTDADGAYRFDALVTGTYQVEATRPGFETAAATVEIVAGETATFDAVLAPSDDAICDGTIDGIDFPGTLTVPEGATCELTASTVADTTTVSPGGRLVVGDSALAGVRAAGVARTSATTIDGDLEVADGGTVVVRGDRVAGAITVGADGSISLEDTSASSITATGAAVVAVLASELTDDEVGLRATATGFTFLEDARVAGPVQVADGAGDLLVLGGSIGSVDAVDADVVELEDVDVAGDVTVRSVAFGVTVCGSDIDGSAVLVANDARVGLGDARFAGCSGNVVAGDVTVDDNRGPTSVVANVIGGGLACTGNDPAPTGRDNVVGAAATGQCADLVR